MPKIFVSKKDKQRHRLLQTLNTKTLDQKFHPSPIDFREWAMPVEELCTLAKITDKEYRKINSLLFSRGEIKITAINNKEHIYILQPGLTALNDESYLKEGAKKFHDSIYDVTKWSIPVLLFIITIYTTFVNVKLNKDNKQRIEQIKSQVDSLLKEKDTARNIIK